MPVRQNWIEPAPNPTPPQGAPQMTRTLQHTGWIALGISIAMLGAAAFASMAGGLHVEAGGIHMTLHTSAETGLKLVFAAAK